MIPQQSPIAHLVQACNSYAVLIWRHMLCNNIHRRLTQVQIGTDPCRGSHARSVQHILQYPCRQFSCTHPISIQIMCHIHKYLINRINMNVFRSNIFKINIVNLCAVFHIKSHPGRRYNITKFQLRMFFQLVVLIRSSGKSSTGRKTSSLPVDLFYPLHHFKQSGSPGNPIGFERWRHRKTNGLLRSCGICHHKVGGKRIQLSFHAFYRGVKRLQINGNINILLFLHTKLPVPLKPPKNRLSGY